MAGTFEGQEYLNTEKKDFWRPGFLGQSFFQRAALCCPWNLDNYYRLEGKKACLPHPPPGPVSCGFPLLIGQFFYSKCSNLHQLFFHAFLLQFKHGTRNNSSNNNNNNNNKNKHITTFIKLCDFWQNIFDS